MEFKKKTWKKLLEENNEFRDKLKNKSKDWWIYLIIGFLLGTGFGLIF